MQRLNISNNLTHICYLFQTNEGLKAAADSAAGRATSLRQHALRWRRSASRYRQACLWPCCRNQPPHLHTDDALTAAAV